MLLTKRNIPTSEEALKRNVANRQYHLATVYGGIARILSIATRFISVPLLIGMLGQERYGSWLIMSSILGWIAFADLGVPVAFQNQLTKIIASEDNEREKAFVAYSIQLLLKIALLICLTLTPVFLLVNWSTFFQIEQPLELEFNVCLIICLLGFAANMPAKLGTAIYAAHQHVAMTPMVAIISQVAGFSTILVAYYLRFETLYVVVLASIAGVLFGPVTFTFAALRRYGYGVLSVSKPLKEDQRAILSKGVFFLATTIGELLILQSDSIMVGSMLGAAQVPLLLVPLGLFINLLQLQNIFLAPSWPILAKHYTQREELETRSVVRKNVVTAIALGAMFLFGCTILGPWFVHEWSGGKVEMSRTMAVGLGIFGLLAAIDNAIATCLNAFSAIEARFLYTTAFGLGKVALGVVTLHYASLDLLPYTYAACVMVISLPFALAALNARLNRLRAET